MALIITQLLDRKYPEFKDSMARFKTQIEGAITRMAAGSVQSDFVIGIYRSLGRERESMNAFSALSGIVQYVKDAEDNQLYDVSVETADVVSETQSAIDWIAANFPQSGGYVLYLELSNGATIPRSFTSGQTAGLRTALQSIVDAITS